MSGPKIAIVIYSMYGHVAAMAEAIKKGIEEAGGQAVIAQVAETLSEDILQKMGAPPKQGYPIISPADLAGKLYEDGEIWPMGESEYYLGRMPIVDGMIPRRVKGRERERYVSRIAGLVHENGVRLAGRIWGKVLRVRAKWKKEKENGGV